MVRLLARAYAPVEADAGIWLLLGRNTFTNCHRVVERRPELIVEPAIFGLGKFRISAAMVSDCGPLRERQSGRPSRSEALPSILSHVEGDRRGECQTVQIFYAGAERRPGAKGN